MSESVDLLPVHEAVVDFATVDQLFFDLAQQAEIVEVRIKASKGMYATAEAPTLEAAKAALSSREAVGIQLRYRFAGAEWLDTLFPVSGGIRIVRVQVP